MQTHREQLLALEAKSIRLNPGTRMVFPRYGNYEEQVQLSRWQAYFGERVYASNNGVICFIDGVNVYVTPSNEEKKKILEILLYEKREFPVPFSNWDYPKEEREQWERLLEENRSLTWLIQQRTPVSTLVSFVIYHWQIM